MNKLERYLEKINAEYTTVKFGYDYFTNAPKTEKEAVVVNFYHRADAEKFNRILTYMKRNRYIKVSDGINNEYYTMIIMTNQDAEEIETYLFYRNLAVVRCEELIHKHHIGDYKGNLSEDLKNIMDEYGSRYNAHLINVNIA